jgi:hypothetical protein
MLSGNVPVITGQLKLGHVDVIACTLPAADGPALSMAHHFDSDLLQTFLLARALGRHKKRSPRRGDGEAGVMSDGRVVIGRGRAAFRLHAEFPALKGLSRSNPQYMRSFAEAWPAFDPNVPRPVDMCRGATSAPLDKRLGPEQGTRTPPLPSSTAGPATSS